MNALRHGLRARSFALLPEEDPAEWAGHLADLRRDLGPVDPTEEKLVTALAVAMWKEIRADRAEAGVLARMTGDGDRGRDLGEKRNALALATAIRYAGAAGMATQRAHRAFLAHRKAKQAGLILPAKEPVAVPAGRNDTNDLAAGRAGARPRRWCRTGPPAKRTDDLPRVDTAATAEGEERTNDLLGPGATGSRAPEPPPAAAVGGDGPPGASGLTLAGPPGGRLRRSRRLRTRPPARLGLGLRRAALVVARAGGGLPGRHRWRAAPGRAGARWRGPAPCPRAS